jgi:uncharacterized protein YbcI
VTSGTREREQLTRGQIENAIAQTMVRFQAELTGHGPTEARCYILEDMVLVRMKGILSKVEERLSRSSEGRRVVKELRQVLREEFRNELEAIIAEHTGCQVTSSHSDISTRTGERVEIYVLDRNLERELARRT